MAPEKIAQKNKYSSEKADIFSLGVSLIILLFLEYPFGQDRETGWGDEREGGREGIGGKGRRDRRARIHTERKRAG